MMQRRVVISIVSHGHQNLIRESGLVVSVRNFEIILRENKPNTEKLIENSDGFTFVQNISKNGFGANHNRNFEIANLDDEDWFIVCNPDIITSAELVTKLLSLAEDDKASIAVPALWNNKTNRFDDNVRPFPSVTSLFLSFAGVPEFSRYKTGRLHELINPDWASGAFMAFKASTFRKLRGFDERFFMYMEDVDICRRAKRIGIKINFYPEIEIIHNAARNSRAISSRNFKYHIKSIMKYFTKTWLSL